MLLKGMDGAMAVQAAGRMRGLISRYLIAHVKAYGAASCRFKHHQLLHIPDWICAWKRLLSCFVLERKHIAIKRALELQKGLRVMCRAGLNQQMLHSVHLLECPGWVSHLIDAVPYPEMDASLGARNAQVSRSIRWQGANARCKDVVFLDYGLTYLVVVVACVSFETGHLEFGLVVNCGARISSHGTQSVWRIDPEPALYRLVDEPMIHVAFFRQLADDTIEVLH